MPTSCQLEVLKFINVIWRLLKYFPGDKLTTMSLRQSVTVLVFHRCKQYGYTLEYIIIIIKINSFLTTVITHYDNTYKQSKYKNHIYNVAVKIMINNTKE